MADAKLPSFVSDRPTLSRSCHPGRHGRSCATWTSTGTASPSAPTRRAERCADDSGRAPPALARARLRLTAQLRRPRHARGARPRRAGSGGAAGARGWGLGRYGIECAPATWIRRQVRAIDGGVELEGERAPALVLDGAARRDARNRGLRGDLRSAPKLARTATAGSSAVIRPFRLRRCSAQG